MDLRSGINTFQFGPIGYKIGAHHSLRQISIFFVPLYSSYKDFLYENDDNPLTKLRRQLDTKYGMDWEFTERDRKLFNEGAKKAVYISYSNGQLMIKIYKDSNNKDQILLMYNSEKWGRHLMEKRRPKNANTNDF